MYTLMKKNLKMFYRYQLPAIIWALLIFIQSSIPNLSTPSFGFTFQDKVAHGIIYGILGFLTTRALFASSRELLSRHAIIFSIFFGCMYAVSDEFHQSFVPGRYSEIGDLIADFIGVLSVQLLFYNRKLQPARSFSKKALKED